MRSLVVQVRLIIEKFAISRIIDDVSAEDLSRLKSVLSKLRQACEEGSEEALRQYDLEFHRTLIEFNHDKELINLWQPFVNRMMLHYGRHSDLIESYKEHLAIFEAIANHDLQAAMQGLEMNLRY